jgi:hypothetical protein
VRVVARALVATALAALASAPSAAFAYEDQVGFSIEAGYAVAPSGLPPHGVYGEVGVSVGLGDVWEIRGRIGYAYHPEPMHRWVGALEVVYLIDVFEVVPFLGLGVDGFVTLNAGSTFGDFAAHAVVGLDVLLSRDLTLGLAVRPAVVFTALDTAPVWLEAGARLQWLFPV